MTYYYDTSFHYWLCLCTYLGVSSYIPYTGEHIVMRYSSYDPAVQYGRLPTCPAHIDVTYTIANEAADSNNNFNETLTTINTYAVPFIEIMEQAAKISDKFVYV